MSANWLAPLPDHHNSRGEPALTGFDLLEQLRREDPRALRAAGGVLAPDYVEAFQAWGVHCYENGRYRDAVTLFAHLCRLQPEQARHLKAVAASHLGDGDVAASAAAYQRAHALARNDAEILFFWSQAALLAGQPQGAAERLRLAQTLSQAQAHKWPELAGWCAELLARLDAGPPATGRAHHGP